jgi:Sulfotransferase domain
VQLGRDVKIVWIASAARCGSTWVQNVTRGIARAAGLEVLPAKATFRDTDKIAAAEEGMHDPEPGRVRVLKTHHLLSFNVPLSRFILPRRDLKDSMVSYMRFMRCDFENAMTFARTVLKTERHYGVFPRERALTIDYSGIITRPEETAQKIAAFLEVPLDEQSISAIVDEFSKENVARLIARKEQNVEQRQRLGLPIGCNEVILSGREIVRVYDTATGFQSGHISDYQDGDWKTILSADQIARLEALTEETDQPPHWKATAKF